MWLSKHLYLQPGVSLLLKTYENYKGLVEAGLARDVVSILRRLVSGAELFDKRHKQAGYGRVSDGAGPSNLHMEDYRLAAIRVWCEHLIGPLTGAPDDIHRCWWRDTERER